MKPLMVNRIGKRCKDIERKIKDDWSHTHMHYLHTGAKWGIQQAQQQQ